MTVKVNFKTTSYNTVPIQYCQCHMIVRKKNTFNFVSTRLNSISIMGNYVQYTTSLSSLQYSGPDSPGRSGHHPRGRQQRRGSAAGHAATDSGSGSAPTPTAARTCSTPPETALKSIRLIWRSCSTPSETASKSDSFGERVQCHLNSIEIRLISQVCSTPPE